MAQESKQDGKGLGPFLQDNHGRGQEPDPVGKKRGDWTASQDRGGNHLVSSCAPVINPRFHSTQNFSLKGLGFRFCCFRGASWSRLLLILFEGPASQSAIYGSRLIIIAFLGAQTGVIVK